MRITIAEREDTLEIRSYHNYGVEEILATIMQYSDMAPVTIMSTSDVGLRQVYQHTGGTTRLRSKKSGELRSISDVTMSLEELVGLLTAMGCHLDAYQETPCYDCSVFTTAKGYTQADIDHCFSHESWQVMEEFYIVTFPIASLCQNVYKCGITATSRLDQHLTNEPVELIAAFEGLRGHVRRTEKTLLQQWRLKPVNVSKEPDYLLSGGGTECWVPSGMFAVPVYCSRTGRMVNVPF